MIILASGPAVVYSSRKVRQGVRNTPQKTLESWKQIAGYLERSERTVRRWETTERLPVHRREHEKQDTVFAYKHEIDAWSRVRTKCPPEISLDETEALPESRGADRDVYSISCTASIVVLGRFAERRIYTRPFY